MDDRDFQIVKTYGKGVGIASKDHQFPNFETYREQIDGKYWFPTYTHADDVLHFPNLSQRIRMVVRYTRITNGSEPDDHYLRRRCAGDQEIRLRVHASIVFHARHKDYGQ